MESKSHDAITSAPNSPLKQPGFKRLLLFGCGGHARSLIDVVESTAVWKIVGLVGKHEDIGGHVLGYPILGSDADLEALRDLADHAVLALGHFGSTEQRRVLAERIRVAGFHAATLVSSHAVVSPHSSLGIGTTIGHGVIINAGVSVGDHCIINSRALIEHDARIGNHCHVSTGALLNGGVRLGDDSFVGSGAMIRESLVLPSNTVISAGLRVMGWPLRRS